MQIKNENSIKYLENKSASSIIQLYFQINHLKNLFRQGWLQSGIKEEHCETVAEHCFSMSTLAIFVKDNYFSDLDIGKVLTLCLIHEFGEIIAGDITPQDGISLEEQSKKEEDGVRRLLTGMPNAEYYVSLWIEFEKGSSLEAKLVRQLDKLDMAFQSKIYEL